MRRLGIFIWPLSIALVCAGCSLFFDLSESHGEAPCESRVCGPSPYYEGYNCGSCGSDLICNEHGQCVPSESESDTNQDTDSKSSSGQDTGDTLSDSGTDTDSQTTTSSDTSTEAQCLGQPDFTPCVLVTEPDRTYDICLSGQCESPGCGEASCNAPGPAFPLPDTNQRFCYDDSARVICPSTGERFHGQDAQYGWDLSHDESARFERTAPVSHEPLVRDSITGLMWQGCMAGLSGSVCTTGQRAGFLWTEAVEYCDQLSWAGHTDWRLPNHYELDSLVDAGRDNPSFDPSLFPNATATMFWSLTSAADSGSAWIVSFNQGASGPLVKTWSNRVWCVRDTGSANRGFSRSTHSGDPVVVDQQTGFAWQGCAAGLSDDSCALGTAESFTWADALEYCETLSWGGKTDWRLPNRRELLSIADHRRYTPAVDPEAFPRTPSSMFWSSSSVSSQAAQAWGTHFADGSVKAMEKSKANVVRCVRNQL